MHTAPPTWLALNQKHADTHHPASKASESRLYSFSGETKEHLRKFRLTTSRAKDPQAVICTLPHPTLSLFWQFCPSLAAADLASLDMIDKNTHEIRQALDDYDEKRVYKSLDEVGEDLPDHAPRFVLLSYPITTV